MPDSTANRRHFTRIAFDTPGQLLSAGGGTEDVGITDLSLRGALLHRQVGAPELAIGDSCTLRVQLGEPGAMIRMQGVVARIDGPLLGLVCRNIDIDSATHLRRLVELNLGKPQLLERELAALVGEG